MLIDAAPNLGTPAVTQQQILAPAGLAVPAAGLDAPPFLALPSTTALTAAMLSPATPVLSAPAGGGPEFASDIADLPPVLDAPLLSEIYLMAPSGLPNDVPEFSAPSLRRGYDLISATLTGQVTGAALQKLKGSA